MANAIDDTASYARVYQAVMAADKRRRSRSVETRAGFPPIDKAECSVQPTCKVKTHG